MREHCQGSVLDVGGGDFFLTARQKGIPFDRWTTLEVDRDRVLEVDDDRWSVVFGDGCDMDLPTDSYDTFLSIQVLEHVLEPLRMLQECARVLRPGRFGILLIPATSTMHLAPHYYGNFSRFWVHEAMAHAGLEVVEFEELGGVWSSAASHHLYFFLQAARVAGMSDPSIKRPRAFWLLLPFQALYSLIAIPICLLFGLGDLAEEPNNHLVVVRKPAAA